MDDWERKWLAYKRVLRESDVVVQVVDARDPKGTLSRELTRYKSKMVVAANKVDLAGPGARRQIAELLPRHRVAFTSWKTGEGIQALLRAIRDAAKTEKPRVAFVGYPNVGKSSLMNRIAGKKIVRVSPLPGETRGVQWVSLPFMFLVDTPGVVPRTEKSGKGLALKGAVRADRIPDPEPIAEEILARFLKARPASVKECYGIPAGRESDPARMLEKIAFRRGRLLKGGEPDLYEAAKTVIRDYQRGRLCLAPKKTGSGRLP
ncbi:MAG: 50S ribosome-binding GTPase [Candidatus ainarchaeum sp.]|nr:50S ribosome-binding GTPase [Candidatus ainarchaeum sp.]